MVETPSEHYWCTLEQALQWAGDSFRGVTCRRPSAAEWGPNTLPKTDVVVKKQKKNMTV